MQEGLRSVHTTGVDFHESMRNSSLWIDLQEEQGCQRCEEINVQNQRERRRLTILYSTSKGTKYIQGPPGSLDRRCVGGYRGVTERFLCMLHADFSGPETHPWGLDLTVRESSPQEAGLFPPQDPLVGYFKQFNSNLFSFIFITFS